MKNFLQAIGYFAAALLFVLSAVYLSNLINPKQVPVSSTSSRPSVSCSPDFPSYNELSSNSRHVVHLISRKKYMHAEDGEFINSNVIITKSETETSKVACGYLFVQAGTRNGALQSTWEDVYINPNGFGGHLDKNSAISVNDSDSNSQYLFALNKIQYWSRANRQDERTSDWAALLNVSETVPFIIALNTEAKSGFIDEVSIAYKCWNPQTGEENDGCQLNVQTKPDTTQTLL